MSNNQDKRQNGTIEIKDSDGKVIHTLSTNEFMDEIMNNDHALVTEVRRAVVFG